MVVEQIELDLGLPVEEPLPSKAVEPNKMARAYGYGPEGAKCKTCKHCFAKRYAGTYYKCEKLGNTNGPGTDIRLKWRACAKYEEIQK